ncbi:MAG: hypothetical protein AAFQ43_11645 [Bacteroidota bacterium]
MKIPALALLAALVAGTASAQTGPEPTPPEASGGGIHITGNWTLDVRDADGTLVESHDFHNDLTRNGANLLINFFTERNRLAGLNLEVRTDAPGVEQPCTDASGTPVGCFLLEPEDPLFGTSETFPLTITKLTESDGSPIVLARFTGTVTADRDSEINTVYSRVATCLYNVSEPCTIETRTTTAGLDGSVFTFRTLDTPLAVAEGQSVDVRFELSFDY